MMTIGNPTLKPRDIYLNQLIAFRDTEPVKVVTGIRRCGKSSLLKLMQQHLLATGVSPEQIIDINFESMAFREMDVKAFYRYVRDHIPAGKRAYLFFDELQRLDQWEDAVNSFRVDFDCDQYITGSNACLLSSEYATYLSGRYVEIRMYPLSFREFLDFHGYSAEACPNPLGGKHWVLYDAAHRPAEAEDLLEAYMRYGGMPGISDVGLSQDKVQILLDGIYSTVVVRDILERERRRGQRQITDAELLRRLVLFLADNIGNSTSLHTIGSTLVNEKLLENRSKQGRPANQTLAAYIGALKEAYLFYEVRRYDVKGKEELRTLGKYYIVDTGLRHHLLGFREGDTGHIIENIVYFELLRRGYDVSVGKVGTREVDFIAARDGEKIYYQVTDEMIAETTRERELAPLREIRDNYEKVIIARSLPSAAPVDGIRLCRLTDFLLESSR